MKVSQTISFENWMLLKVVIVDASKTATGNEVNQRTESPHWPFLSIGIRVNLK